MEEQFKLGVSSCLLGHNVRYDGGHRRDPYITDTLSRYVQFIPVCPEVECWLPIPREAMRLEGDPQSPRLITIHTKQDLTEMMLSWCSKKVRELEDLDLSGFIFKKGSPSSGMERVKVYDDKGVPSNRGIGMFARAFMDHFPLLPVEEDERLYDLEIRENFIESIFVMKRLRETPLPKPTRGGFADFHAKHKLLLMAHSPHHLREMGKLVAGLKDHSVDNFRVPYQKLLLKALRLKATPRKHTAVLRHCMGVLKKLLSPDEERELLESIEEYSQGCLPLIIPVTVLNHYVRKYEPPDLKDQYYLKPHPVELMLRNHA